VELQRCEQAEHGLRHLGGNDHETLVLGRLEVRQAVQATPNPFQQTSGGQAGQNDPGASMAFKSLARSSPFWLARPRTRCEWVSGSMAGVCSVYSSK
jgi:hypothetical protein